MPTTSFSGRKPEYLGLSLGGLEDIDTTSPADGEVLMRNSTTGKWENQAPSVAGLSDTQISSPTGNEVLVRDAATDKWVNQTLYQRTNVYPVYGIIPYTYTAGAVLGGVIWRDPGGSSGIDTTPSAAEIVAAMTNPKTNNSFRLVIQNLADGPETITLAAGTGVTLYGTMTIPQNFSREFIVLVEGELEGSEAVSFLSIGSSQH